MWLVGFILSCLSLWVVAVRAGIMWHDDTRYHFHFTRLAISFWFSNFHLCPESALRSPVKGVQHLVEAPRDGEDTLSHVTSAKSGKETGREVEGTVRAPGASVGCDSVDGGAGLGVGDGEVLAAGSGDLGSVDGDNVVVV